MMTKDDERKALAAIEAILNKCDPDGYVATAFSGCVADALDNINNDFANSYRDRYILAEDRRAEAARDLVKVRAELAAVKIRVENAAAALAEARAQRDKERAARAAAEAEIDRLNDWLLDMYKSSFR